MWQTSLKIWILFPHRCGKHVSWGTPIYWNLRSFLMFPFVLIWTPCIFQPVGHQLLCGQASSSWTSRVTSMPPGSWSWLCFMSLGCGWKSLNICDLSENFEKQVKFSATNPPQKIISTQRAPGSIFCPELSAGGSFEMFFLLVEKNGSFNTRFRCL